MTKNILILGAIACIGISAQRGSASIPELCDLSVDQKIGQLFMIAAFAGKKKAKDILSGSVPYEVAQDRVETLIEAHQVGGIIFLGKAMVEDQLTLTNHYQSLSKVPLLIGQDFEWGLSMRLHNTVRFPHNMTLGAVENDQLIHEMGKEVGKQMQAIGVHINFAPVVDVNNNPANPIINDRSFGKDPERVARKGIMFMQGMRESGALSCAKHFPGHGDTDVDSHLDLPVIRHSRKRLETIELYPFRQLIDAQVDAVMLAHLEIPALDATPHLPSCLSPAIVTGLLREQMGFKGLIITDALGMQGVIKHHEPGELELKALLAGNDILLCPLDVPKAVVCIKQALADGRFSEKALDERVGRILQIKRLARIQKEIPYDQEVLYSPAAYALKRELYTKAITLVRDQENTIPLRLENTALILFGGTAETPFNDFLQQQRLLSGHYFPAEPTSEAIAKLPGEIGEKTVVIALLGMNTFASRKYGIADSNREAIQSLQDGGKKVVLVIFGNPYSLSFFEKIPTVIVAYEDDIEAQKAAAQLLIGEIEAEGILPV